MAKGTVTRVFVLKSTSAGPIPERLNEAQITIRLADRADTIEDALFNMLALCDTDPEKQRAALIDTFNSAAALEQQKKIKEYIEANAEATLADVQKYADGYLIQPNQRGGSRGGVVAEAKRKAEKLDTVKESANAVLADLDTREAAGEDVSAERALMEKLGLI